MTNSIRQIDPARVHAALDAVLQSPSFRTSKQCQALLRYIVEHSLAGNEDLLRERVIGASVFRRPPDYDTGNDPVVRARAGEIRKRLAQHYMQEGSDLCGIRIDIPSGSYQASFEVLSVTQTAPAATEVDQPSGISTPLITPKELPADDSEAPSLSNARRQSLLWSPKAAIVFLSVLCVLLGLGWFHAAVFGKRFQVPWPLDQVVGQSGQATVVLADAAYTLRLLGNKQIPLDQYINRSYIKQVMPAHMTPGEETLFNYLAASRITSMADAQAAATLTELAGPYAHKLFFRSARDLNSTDLNHGNLIFVGASSSNPWVQLYESELNFYVTEDPSVGGYGILNRTPQAGEQRRYTNSGATGSSGESFAAIALLPNRNGSGKILVIQGLRMEDTMASIDLLRNEALRSKLQSRLRATNHGAQPLYFEALLRVQSVAGAPVTVECQAVRILDQSAH